MSEAVTIKSISIAGRDVQARELSVSAARKIFANEGGDIIDDFLFEEVRLSDLEIMTNLTSADLDGMTPSQIAQVIALVKEQNPHFFKFLARLSKGRAEA
ncbi:hypothetical protein ACUTAH_02670 [Metapseudomonas furukawaii]|uniref:hypothetical protein n=1 Tax=Metapseudomonas furukawaii TaxID=1149133 RepID=UPI0040462009